MRSLELQSLYREDTQLRTASDNLASNLQLRLYQQQQQQQEKPESSSIQRQVLPQQQDSVISVRGHTWIAKDSNARKRSGASSAGNVQNQRYWNKKVQQ
ncbi:unnamed protein product [Sphagnum jensenii]